jgi:hypothetical protein
VFGESKEEVGGEGRSGVSPRKEESAHLVNQFFHSILFILIFDFLSLKRQHIILDNPIDDPSLFLLLIFNITFLLNFFNELPDALFTKRNKFRAPRVDFPVDSSQVVFVKIFAQYISENR